MLPGSTSTSGTRTSAVGDRAGAGALLAAEAAIRAGAGKPQVATVASVAVAVSVPLPEALVTDLPEADDGEIAPIAGRQVLDLGLGQIGGRTASCQRTTERSAPAPTQTLSERRGYRGGSA